MGLQRSWLDIERPLVSAAAAWLVGRYGTLGGCDLRQVILVVPARRGTRLLLHELMTRCAADGLRLIPPRLVTPAAMIEELWPTPCPIASAIEMELAWLGALREAPRKHLSNVMPDPPGPDDLPAWHALARIVAEVHRELSAELVSFTDAQALVDELDQPAEARRWQALTDVRRAYLERLVRAGVEDPAEARAAHPPREPRNAEELILVGVPELRGIQRALVRAFGDRAFALIHAPSAWAKRFDELGCVEPARWPADEAPIDDAAITFAGDPHDQAGAVMHALNDLDGERAAEEITIGVVDRGLLPAMHLAAEMSGVELHDGAGEEVVHSSPVRLLELIGAWLSTKRATAMAALLRHPDIETWLDGLEETTNGSRVTSIDGYINDHLPLRLGGRWLGTSTHRRTLEVNAAHLDRLLQPLTAAARPWREWIEPVARVLHAIYAEGEVDDGTRAALEAVRESLATISDTRPTLHPTVDAPDAVRLVLSALAEARVAPVPREGQIEMVGWLELHIDPAPVLVVAGANDGALPGSRPDPFLPDGVRARLGLDHDARRLARDTYLLAAIVASRPRTLAIAGRFGTEGDPLAPSRLLLSGDHELILRRLGRFAGEGEVPPLVACDTTEQRVSRFLIPELPDDLLVPQAMAVSDFRRYLECPFRYALGRLHRLAEVTDDLREMTPLTFGSLGHAVLEEFGRDEEARELIEPDAITRYLHAALDKDALWRFGNEPLPAVRVQLARLRQRFRTFARHQARWRRAGWRIEHVELSFGGEEALLIPDDAPMPLRARIDRIDRHTDGSVRIIDYKFGEEVGSPRKSHNGTARVSPADDIPWFDLQLPLYVDLARQRLALDDPIDVGYVALPRDPRKVDYYPGGWTTGQLVAALEVARGVVRDVRGRRFPRTPRLRRNFDAFDRICQTRVFGAQAVTVDEEGAL